jgi:hypothetical protein
MEQTCGCCLMDFRCDILTSGQVIYPDHPGCVTQSECSGSRIE